MQNLDFTTFEKTAEQVLMDQNRIKCHTHLSTTRIRNLSKKKSSSFIKQAIADDIVIQRKNKFSIPVLGGNSLRRA